MDQKRYIDFYDMIDGGGAGQTGDKFEGGGLLSALANLVADPYGSQDPERMQKLQQMRGLLDTGMDMGGSAPTPPQVINRQIVPTYGADAGIAATERAMDMPYNQPTSIPAMGGEDLLMSMPVTPSAETNKMGAMLNVPPAYDYASMVPQGSTAIQEVPSTDVYKAASDQLVQELGNAFVMMPMQERMIRIQQRVDMMRGM